MKKQAGNLRSADKFRNGGNAGNAVNPRNARSAGAVTRATAQPRSSNSEKRGSVIGALAVVALLLCLPLLALHQLCQLYDWRIIVGLVLAVSLVAFIVSAEDKRRARNGLWRVPEATLHLLELVGGWPGSFLAQRIFRHKISKLSYQFVFWLIVVLYQYVALDYLRGWAWLKSLWSLLQKHGS